MFRVRCELNVMGNYTTVLRFIVGHSSTLLVGPCDLLVPRL